MSNDNDHREDGVKMYYFEKNAHDIPSESGGSK